MRSPRTRGPSAPPECQKLIRLIEQIGFLTLPMAKARGFSVLRRGQRHASPTALTEPFYVLRRVVVPMQGSAAVRAAMPADRETLLDQHSAAATDLRGVRGMDGNDFPTGACCLVGKNGQERAQPASWMLLARW